MKKKIVYMVLLAFVLCNTSSVYSQEIDFNSERMASESGGTTTLQGYVSDAYTGEALADILITSFDGEHNINRTVNTDENGYYFIDYGIDEKLNVSLNFGGHYPHECHFNLEAGQLNTHDVYLTFVNTAPSINGEVYWTETSTVQPVHFGLVYIDPEQDYPSIKNVIIDGKEYEMDFLEVRPSGLHWYEADIHIREAGEYNCYFYFEDEYGAGVRYPSEGYQTFTVYNYPGTPINPTPADEATDMGRTVLLEWENFVDEEEYDTNNYVIYFGTEEDLHSIDTSIEQEYKLTRLKPNTKYYWKIGAWIDIEQGGWWEITGPTWSFTTASSFDKQAQIKMNLFERFPLISNFYLSFLQLIKNNYRTN